MKKSTIAIISGVFSIVLFSILPNVQGLIMGYPLEYWDSADIILDGTVLERFNETDGLVQHDVKVEQYFKNPKSQTMITVYGPGIHTEDFFYPKIFEKGQRVLFYLKKMDDKYIILEQSREATEKCDPRSMIGLSTLPGEPLARGGPTLFYDPYQTCNGYLIPPGFLRDSLAPLKQLQAGIKLGDIGCHNNLQLMFRHSGEPACVKNSSVSRLLDYGWTLVKQGDLDLRTPLPTVTIADLPKQIDNETPLSFAIEVLDIIENHDRPTISITNENQQKVWSGQWLNPNNSGYLASGAEYNVQYYKEDFPEKITLDPGNFMVSVSLDKQTVSKKVVVVPKMLGTESEPEKINIEKTPTEQKYADCPVSFMKVSDNGSFQHPPPMKIEDIGRTVNTFEEAKSITGIDKWSLPKYIPKCLELKQILVQDNQDNRKEILILYVLNDIDMQSLPYIDDVLQHGFVISFVYEKDNSSIDWKNYLKNLQSTPTIFDIGENTIMLTERNNFQFSPSEAVTIIGNDRITLASYIMDADEIKTIVLSMLED